MIDRECALQELADRPEGTIRPFQPADAECAAGCELHSRIFIWRGKLYCISGTMDPRVIRTPQLQSRWFAILERRAVRLLSNLQRNEKAEVQ